MRIYNRNSRQNVRHYLRLLRTDLTPIDYWTLILALSLLCFVILWPAAASAQDDPCAVCWAEWGAACPCLPAAPEPPTSGLACVPQTHDIGGCDKMFLAAIGRQP